MAGAPPFDTPQHAGVDDSVLIIGPMGVGKSGLAKRLVEKLDRPRCCVDEVQWTYFPDLGFDHERARKLLRTDKAEFMKYSSPFMLSAVERALQEHPGHILDFGAGHAAYDEPDLADRFRKLLQPYPFVLLLMPSPEISVCLASLPGPEDERPMNPLFIRHSLKEEVAKRTIFTLGKSVSQVAEEVVQWVTHSKQS